MLAYPDHLSSFQDINLTKNDHSFDLPYIGTKQILAIENRRRIILKNFERESNIKVRQLNQMGGQMSSLQEIDLINQQ